MKTLNFRHQTFFQVNFDVFSDKEFCSFSFRRRAMNLKSALVEKHRQKILMVDKEKRRSVQMPPLSLLSCFHNPPMAISKGSPDIPELIQDVMPPGVFTSTRSHAIIRRDYIEAVAKTMFVFCQRVKNLDEKAQISKRIIRVNIK